MPKSAKAIPNLQLKVAVLESIGQSTASKVRSWLENLPVTGS